MRVLTENEVGSVAGGWTENQYTAPVSGVACANSVMFWGSIGGGFGALIGGVASIPGFFAGAAFGGWGGTFSGSCKINPPLPV
jgi:hypothetical protein